MVAARGGGGGGGGSLFRIIIIVIMKRFLMRGLMALRIYLCCGVSQQKMDAADEIE